MGQIEDLRLFALVVENRSISGAAEKLHIAKSAVSRRLQLLEQRYGTRLIDRTPGIWDVTATGRELYQRAVSVVNDVDEIESDFTDSDHNLAGALTISVPREFGLEFLKGSLLTFAQRHREIQLTVDFDDHPVDLARENYDFAIRITPKLESNLLARKIGFTRHQLCATPAYLQDKGTPTTIADLHDHALLYFGTARRAQWDFLGPAGKPESIEFQPALNSNNGVFLIQATLQGLGIARAPDFITSRLIESGELVPVLPELTVPDWGIYLMHAAGRRHNRRMRLFSKEMEIACLEQDFHLQQSLT